MKKKLLTFLLLLSILIFSTTIVFAEAGRLSTSGFEIQEESNWCWVASALNSVHYETKNHRTQKAAVLHLKGSLLGEWYPNVRGSISDVEDAAEYISKNTEEYTGINVTCSFSFLKKEIELDNVTIAGLGYFNEDGERTGGHAVAIIGYRVVDGNNVIEYYDPWDGSINLRAFVVFCDSSYEGKEYVATCYNNES